MMKKLFFLFLLISQIAFPQNNQLWKGYFSYNDVNDLTESPTKIVASTQKALFSKNLNTNELKTVSTIDGLSGQNITAIYYSQTYNKTFVGHANGLMLIINESDGKIKIVPGIRDQNGITPTKKKINHFLEHNNKLYISTDFGLVQFNLDTLLFGDTYLLGNAGQELLVYQSTVFNNFIYVATDAGGIRRADLLNPNLNDFAQWSTFDPGSWIGITTHNNTLVALSANNSVSRHNGSSFSLIINLPQYGFDLRTFNNVLTITTQNHVYAFDQNFIQTAHVLSQNIPDMIVNFNCATVIGNTFYIGTREYGIISAPLSNTSTFQIIKPDGPSRNNGFALKSTPSNDLWLTYGGYDINYSPDTSPYGISKLTETGWINMPFEDLLSTTALSRITLNPSDEKNVFFSSFHNGILEFQDDIALARYDQNTPNGPQSLLFPPDPSYKSVRVNGAAFDRQGNFWFNNSSINNAVKVLKSDGSWQSYPIGEFVSSFEQHYGNLVIDKNGTKWFPSQNGLMGFNENVTPKFKKAESSEDAGNPLLNNVRTVAIDNNNRVWIGTRGGLRILSSADRFMGEDELETNPIIILDDGLAQELLYEQTILDIVVDGANNKWIATGSSGAFLLSSNGQQTIYHFTRENSPLPSNSINDIEVNPNTGEVFFATDAGLVSFKGTSTGAAGDLSNVYVYPNPVRPEFVGTVKIAGLIDDANIKITDIEGNLVYETTSEGGTIEWDTKAFGKYRVASGVYMIFIASKDGTETKTKKVMIIR